MRAVQHVQPIVVHALMCAVMVCVDCRKAAGNVREIVESVPPDVVTGYASRVRTATTVGWTADFVRVVEMEIVAMRKIALPARGIVEFVHRTAGMGFVRIWKAVTPVRRTVGSVVIGVGMVGVVAVRHAKVVRGIAGCVLLYVVTGYAKEEKHAVPVRMIVVFVRQDVEMVSVDGRRHVVPVQPIVVPVPTFAGMDNARWERPVGPVRPIAVTVRCVGMVNAGGMKVALPVRLTVARVLTHAGTVFAEAVKIARIAGMTVEFVVSVVTGFAG